MNIGIDIQCTRGKLTGIPRYTLNLLEAFSTLENPPEMIPFECGIRRDLKTYERLWWESVKLPSQIGRSAVDLFHAPGFAVRKLRGRKTVITAHDIIGSLFPQNLSKTARLYWSRWLPWCYRRADHLIANSICTKNDLMRHLGIPERNITIVYLASDLKCVRVDPAAARAEIARSLKIHEPYFLFVGTIEPRKNLVRTLKAYAQALKFKKDLPKLMVVGAKEWGTQPFEQAVRELALESHVIATGFVSDDLLWEVYSAAQAVLFVSLYEGFGLPLLEGMTCGVPVIASNNSSLEEIAGNAAYLVDPYSEDQIAGAIMDLARDSRIGQELVNKGLKRAKDFSWRKAAQETLAVYQKLIG